MPQNELIKVLKNNKDKWFTAKQLSKRLKTNTTSITAGLKQLRKFDMVNYRRKKYIHYKFMYQYKR